MGDVKRIDEIKEETLLVLTVLRGEGINGNMCRHVKQYFRKLNNGTYAFLFEEDPCNKKE